MKTRLLSLIAATLAFVVLFTACSKGGENTLTDTDAADGTSASSTEGTENTDNTEKSHNVFGKFESTTLDGKKVDYTVFEGKITMVNIWATFCTPCIAEMPDIERISKKYADKNFQVVGVVSDVYMYPDGSLDETIIGEAEHIVDQTGVSYMNILPSASLNEFKLSNVQYVPETVFLDEKGNAIGGNYIGSHSYEDWCDIIDSVLE